MPQAPIHSRGSLRHVSAGMPRVGLACLAVCLASGLVLCFQYRPMGNVFRSVEEITSLIPYGAYLRQLHLAAGQIFVFFMLAHTTEHFLRKRHTAYPPPEWCRLVLSLVLCFLALFTGFILKGDLEGIFAGRIMLNIVNAIPLAGRWLSRLLLVEGDAFFYLPFLHHCLFIPLLLFYLLRDHVRDWIPDEKYLIAAFAALSLYAAWVPPAMDIPPGATVEHVLGPWFFLAIQYLLIHLPVLWAGLIIPGACLGALLALPLFRSVGADLLRLFIMACACAYAILTLIMLRG